VTVDEANARSAPLLRDGRISRRHLTWGYSACEAGAFLRCCRARPVWLFPWGRAWLRRQGRFEIWPHLAADQSLVLRIADGGNGQPGRKKSDG
jgi:hypothetical protein